MSVISINEDTYKSSDMRVNAERAKIRSPLYVTISFIITFVPVKSLFSAIGQFLHGLLYP